MTGGLLLIASLVLLAWLIARRRPWLARIGGTILEDLSSSAQWYAGVPPTEAASDADPEADVEVADDLASRTEVALTARLLDRTLATDDYQRAMAELAAHDELRRPMSVPRWP